jgi:hypothetical protein
MPSPGATYEAVLDAGETGLVGTLEVGLIDNQGNVAVPFTTAGIIEHPAGSGIYQATGLVAPLAVGQYTQVWLVGSATYGIEDIVVSGLSFGGDPVPAEAGDFGPCTAWIDGGDVAACCDAEVASDEALFDEVAVMAEQLLFGLSGGRFPGLCERTVRPCGSRWCGFQVLSRGHIVAPLGWNGRAWSGDPCGCHALSRVQLAGYPVREITEVKISGDVIDPTGYRLDGHRYLTRLADAEGDTQFWPGCQRLDLADTEEGTFSVSYVWGVAPPAAGISAAAQLACELYRACPGTDGECALPSNTTRVVRQGVEVTLEMGSFLSGGLTGLTFVDAFLSTYGASRPPALWSPDIDPYPQQVG